MSLDGWMDSSNVTHSAPYMVCICLWMYERMDASNVTHSTTQPMYMYMVCIYVFGCMDGCHTLQSNIIDASKSNPFWGGILHLDRDKLQSHVKTMNYRRILVDHVTDKVVAQFDTL